MSKKLSWIIFAIFSAQALSAQENSEPSEPKPAEEIPAKPEPMAPAAPAQPSEAELDPETQRLIEEAKQKIIKERAEKVAAEKKAREDETKRIDAEKAATKDKESKLYLGALGSLGLGLNSIHSVSYGFGATMDVIAYERFGVHLGFSTGVTSTKESQFTSGSTTLSVGSGGTVGFLGVDLAAFYAFPKISNVEAALGGGVTVYKLSNSALSFGSMIAPLIMASAYYPIMPRLQAGAIWSISFPGSSTLSAGGTDYSLAAKQSLTAMSLMVSVRFSAW
jgi:hypothetical protein